MSSRWSILAILFIARTMMAFQFQAVAALAPLVSEAHGASLADIGLLIGLYLAPGIFIALPGGAVAARFGDRRVVLVGLGLMLAGAAMMWLGSEWNMLAAGRIVAGIGGVILNVLMTKMVSDWFAGREIATAMSIYINSWPVGIALALAVLPRVASPDGLALGWAVVFMLIAFATLLFAWRYRAPAARDVPLRKAPVSTPGPGRLPLGALVQAGAIWALYNGALAMLFSFGPGLLTARGWSLASAATTTSIAMWLLTLTIVGGGYLADRSGRRDAVIIFGLAGFAAALVFAALAPPAALPAAILLLGLISGLPAGPIMALPAQILAPKTRAVGMGLFFTIYYGVMMVTPAIGGWMADRAGDVGAAFEFGAGLLAVSLAALAGFRQAARRVPDATGATPGR